MQHFIFNASEPRYSPAPHYRSASSFIRLLYTYCVSLLVVSCPPQPNRFVFTVEDLFRNAVVGVEAVGEGLAVLVIGVVGQHLAAGGALEGLETSLALDCESGGVLARSASAFETNIKRGERLSRAIVPISTGS